VRVSKHAKRQPRVVTLAFDGKFVGSLYEREGPLGHKRPACMLLFVFLRGGVSIHCHSVDDQGAPVLLKPLMAQGQNNWHLVR
jgi:hypothetical protein